MLLFCFLVFTQITSGTASPFLSMSSANAELRLIQQEDFESPAKLVIAINDSLLLHHENLTLRDSAFSPTDSTVDIRGSKSLKLLRYVRDTSEKHICSLRPQAKPVVKNKSLITAAYLVIFTAGLVFNGTVLFIYCRHSEMRTKKNTMFMNLAVADTVFLLVHLGVFKLGHYFKLVDHPTSFGQIGCRLYVLFFVTSFGMNAYSVAAISVQRYLGIAKFSSTKLETFRTFLSKPFCLPIFVWILCIFLAIPEVVFTKICNDDFRCYHPHLFTDGEYPFFVFGVIPGCITAAFYIAAESRLKMESARNLTRVRTGKVLLALSIVYIFTYTPMLLCELMRDWFDTSIHHEEPTVIFCYVAKVIFHLNPSCNPLALYVASMRFRMYFKKYLLCTPDTIDGQVNYTCTQVPATSSNS